VHVVVGLVTWNSARVLAYCLTAVRNQTYRDIELRIADNASVDGTLALLRDGTRPEERLELDRNVGFACAHNRLIESATGDFYLALNPDVELAPDYVATLVAAMVADASAGSATGKLLRTRGPGDQMNRIDSTGIVMLPSQRHLDRGADEEDRGQYERMAYVFGASGAAALYRRRMLEDVKIRHEYFDEDFFAYREDADLAWRAQLLGWTCLYVPAAVARHERRVTPERRSRLPPEINYYSVRNRFLLRIKNQTAGHAARFLLPALARDLQVVGYVLLRERSSLGALRDVWRLLPRAWSKRREIMRRRCRPTRDLVAWFQTGARPA
jgi:GT2 family glycosyltransferase